MGEKIAMGFHTCVDYELVWDSAVVQEQIRALDIHADELVCRHEVDSLRQLWISCLAHLKAGIGSELVPARSEDCNDFADHFSYKVTLGGTATRAALALERLGYPSVIQTSCYNRHVRQLMPADVQVIPGTPSDEARVYPHVIVQCAGGVRIHANDIDFVTPRENRLLISRDPYSLNIPVLDREFGERITDAEVFLLGSLTEILDRDILQGCLEKIKSLLSYLPADAIVVLEDGCYIKKEFRYDVHRQLAPQSHILSMNEDEMQEYIGRRIDILDPDAVCLALQELHQSCPIHTIVIHSAAWALAYGTLAGIMQKPLEGGISMAGTRFRVGDHLSPEEYEKTIQLPDRPDSMEFCRRMSHLLGDQICIVPCKDLRHVTDPTVVGLGDCFAGGILPGLLKQHRTMA